MTFEYKRQKTIIKLSLKYSLMSEGNTCIAEPNLEVLSFTKCNKGLVPNLGGGVILPPPLLVFPYTNSEMVQHLLIFD